MVQNNLETLGLVKAKKKGADAWVTGYLFKLEPSLRCFKSDPEGDPSWYIVTSQPTDWGLPCIPSLNAVDVNTICAYCGTLPGGHQIFEGDKLAADNIDTCGTVVFAEDRAFVSGWNVALDALLAVNTAIPIGLKVVGNIYEKEEA